MLEKAKFKCIFHKFHTHSQKEEEIDVMKLREWGGQGGVGLGECGVEMIYTGLSYKTVKKINSLFKI